MGSVCGSLCGGNDAASDHELQNVGPSATSSSAAAQFSAQAAAAGSSGALNMGEGVTGPSNVRMQTSQMYSCTGVSMTNSAEGRGGLYHYPAESLGNPNVSNTLGQMVGDVRPDKISLTPSTIMPGMETLQRPQQDADLGQLRQELGKHAPVTTTEPNVLASHDPTGDGEEVAVPGNYRGRMKPQARPLDNDARYFGGDGETSGVLDQDPAARRRR